MKKFGHSLKATAFAATLLAGVGMAGEAKALTINSGDLVLAMYNNTTQYLHNLGQVSSIFSSPTPTPFNIAPSDISAVGGTNPVKWALISYSDAGSVPGFSSTKNLSAWTPTEVGQVAFLPLAGVAGNWSAQHSGVYPGGPTQLISAADSLAFTAYFGTDGSLAGYVPVSAEGFFGSTLAVLQGDFSNTLTQLGTASLSADGLSLILAGAPVVPIPAAVILFGTGLAGLVGVARRRMVAA